MKKYPDVNGKLVSYRNWERKDLIIKKLSEMEKLFNEIMELEPDTLSKKDREEILYVSEDLRRDIDYVFFDLE
jgi:hypothetical protein